MLGGWMGVMAADEFWLIPSGCSKGVVLEDPGPLTGSRQGWRILVMDLMGMSCWDGFTLRWKRIERWSVKGWWWSADSGLWWRCRLLPLSWFSVFFFVNGPVLVLDLVGDYVESGGGRLHGRLRWLQWGEIVRLGLRRWFTGGWGMILRKLEACCSGRILFSIRFLVSGFWLGFLGLGFCLGIISPSSIERGLGCFGFEGVPLLWCHLWGLGVLKVVNVMGRCPYTYTDSFGIWCWKGIVSSCG
ncbi:uncharacterized protein LOC121049983 [Rosa chinensis]|uniref:uncharacterized protein LOC121049983 n=1 Tax=Rosa chinensis TaxID=74649 RepID=UPI001AD8C905|nr:uncharacterized protein LOC121049983 [Rosa chinensis]